MADLTSNDRSVIQRLPEHLINQIAAGEVIERPASVIKELVENSLDAQATRIEILLTQGGIEEIQVLDNGCGISRIDLVKAAERHATSKIKTETDLEAISTFGFRGEALSSIASVAQLSLKSRTAHSPSGFEITFKRGLQEGEIKEISAPVGTQVVVNDLFKWVPARFKFLRSGATELSHCQRIVRELALGNPQVRFQLKHEGRTLGSWITSNRKDRLLECLKVSWKPLEFRAKRDDIELEAFFSPFDDKVARTELFLFINGRPVRNRPFLSAIRSVFLEHFGPTYEPVGVCYLDIRKDWVDVNVHPQKWEVRCLQQESIYQWLLATFREQLGMAPRSSTFAVPSASFSSAPRSRVQSMLRFVAQTSTVLICEVDSGLLMADIHTLSQLREKRKLANLLETGHWSKHPLRVPTILNFSKKQIELLALHEKDFKQLGFDIEAFGESDFSLSSYPDFLPEDSAGTIFKSFLTDLEETDFFDSPERLVSFFARHTLRDLLPTFSLLEELEWQMKHAETQTVPGIKKLTFKELKEGTTLT